MKASDVLAKARDAMTVRMAFGDPIVQGDVVVVPAAKVRGGAGGGSENEGDGGGAGFGVTTTPIGAFVIKDGNVRWHPAIDINKIVVGGQIVGVVALLSLRSILKARSRRR
ncbi:sporulation protein [Planosporangium thailandense]|uniref:Sporulation protein n=2 Tax=Planosporangium thailandense TaxID=765197 RepID=A0ABX0Y3B5_9ACTN|nr:sporulation protein [Planosporangium thailandense]